MFDSLTAAALADELAERIENGRVQQVGLISRQTIWFEIFAHRRRSYLIASAEHQAPAVYLTDREPVWDRQLVTPLLLLLRKYARGGRLVSIQQPRLERIITLSFSAARLRTVGSALPVLPEPDDDADEDGDDETADEDEGVFTHLHCEIMGRHSNLILVDDQDLIMDSVKRVTPAMSRVRPIAPRRPFQPPPPRRSLDPRFVTEAELRSTAQQYVASEVLIKKLPSLFQGMSPQIATEAVYRSVDANGDAPQLAKLAQAIRHLYEPLLTNAWKPVIYRDGDDVAAAFAAQPMRHLEREYREEPVESVSRAIEVCEGAGNELPGEGRHGVRATRLAVAIDDALQRIEAKLDALETEEDKHQNREQFREWGELIFGYLWQIKPGDRELVVGDERIPLDPAINPKEQARRYIQQYQDAKSSDQQIGTVRAATQLELNYLQQLRTLAQQAVSIQDIEDLEAEWRARRPSGDKGRSKPRSSGRKRTMPVENVNGHAIFVGKSGSENDRVTFDIAGPDDTWLHARGVPGSHVIVRWNGPDRNDDAVLVRAAELAAYFSQSRASGRVEVDITARRFVRKIKGAGPGMVTYRHERTVSVAPIGPS
jgi:predicted ribosome quality control (RQC) complex YloA/Tae2 family protein